MALFLQAGLHSRWRCGLLGVCLGLTQRGTPPAAARYLPSCTPWGRLNSPEHRIPPVIFRARPTKWRPTDGAVSGDERFGSIV